MTVETQLDRVDYDGNGTSADFSFPYKFFANSDMYVYIRRADDTEDALIFGTDFTLTGVGLEEGGTITLTVPPTSNEKVVIYRDPPKTQLTDYIEGDRFPAESHERALDKVTMLIQRLSNLVVRALSLRVTDGESGGGAFDAKGNRIINVADPINSQDAVTLNSMMTYVAGVISGAIGIVLDTDYGTLLLGDQIKRRRGTTAQHSAFTGAAGEITIDTDKNTAVVHNGVTAGGNALVREKGSTMSGRLDLCKGANVASASALVIGGDGNIFHVTGITQIDQISPAAISGAGPVFLIFDGILSFKNNSNLIQIGGADVTTAAGDIAHMAHEGAGVWRCLAYTRAAGGAGGATIPTGTRMLFNQTAAPTGWTKETNVAYNNQALRLVTGSVSTGGATGFTTVFGSGKVTGSHTLSISEMPTHQHDLFASQIGASGTANYTSYSGSGAYPSGTAYRGGGSGHTHPLSLDLSYRDVIIAQAP